MAIRALTFALVLCCLTGVAAAAPASAPLDIELAIDTTGSMGPSIKRMQRDAARLVNETRARFPGAQFSVVQFKDSGDTPEYEVLQAMTGDPKLIGEAVTRMGPGGGGDNPEGYNVVFRNSYADKSIGWRAGSRKLVVVIGDAEPHGAAAAGFQGCLDASGDPHSLRTKQELVGMKVNGRTLLMVRQGSTATVSLDCYESLAAAAYGGGNARDAGSDLIGAIEGLVTRAARIAGLPAAPAKAKTRSRASTPRQQAPARTSADHTPPRVTAIKSGGTRGTTIRLYYRVSDNSGRSSDKIAVFAGSRVLTQSGWAPFGPANGKAYYFDFPSSGSMAGTYSFCVQSRDPSGNVSRPACAVLLVV
jgi:hypothetical protein